MTHHRLDLIGSGSREALPCFRKSFPRLCVREAFLHRFPPVSSTSPFHR
ncbi:hypothetical protein AALP_AA6G244300 [Arabis alpina]|uniref:Uncharacterized protein n=1 Tax=Arabis alpina TaxID=50452 RepID=A0A087GRF3_ARAAL|nr:hypothetical protein AALP_AA6G244300 [Arabis alpina]